jgi:hypothetical protein
MRWQCLIGLHDLRLTGWVRRYGTDTLPDYKLKCIGCGALRVADGYVTSRRWSWIDDAHAREGFWKYEPNLFQAASTFEAIVGAPIEEPPEPRP